MTGQVLTPQRRGAIVDLGNGTWKKQILPLGSINYRGKKIVFDRPYLDSLVKSFRSSACGPVPFQLADAKNTHTNDPERRRGTVVDLEVTDDGLYGIVELDDDGAKLVERYPDLGVSARIYENYERGDGQFFPAALQHVLGTLDPHVPGMRPWQAVALSNDVSGSVIDLSDLEFATDGKEDTKTVATKSDLKQILAKLRESGDEAELSDDELDQLLAITDAMSAEDKADKTKTPEAKAPDKPAKKDDEDDDTGELTDEELDALIAAAEADVAAQDAGTVEDSAEEEGGDQEVSRDPELIAASQQHTQEIALARQQLERQNIELAAVKAQLAAQRFEAEQRTLATQYGIPPRITDLARPLLEGDGELVVELSNGDQVDASAVMRKVLMELGQTFKALDLSALEGFSEDEPTDSERQQREAAAADTRSFVDTIKNSYSF